MARSVADVLSAHGIREQIPHIPANSEVFDQQESTKLSGDVGGVRPETFANRSLRQSATGMCLSVSLGVHPPCRRGSDSTNLIESERSAYLNSLSLFL